MKKNQILSLVLCLLMFGIVVGCKSKFDEKKYLTQVLNNLEQIKSASYISSRFSNSGMGDVTFIYYAKEFANPADTAAGVSYGQFYPTDTTKVYHFYDGNASIYIRDDIKEVSIDSFKVYRYPFRPVRAFFNSSKNIIKYALTSNDSILKEFHDFGDSLLFSLTIYSDKQVVLIYVRPQYFDNPNYRFGDEINKYDIWIDKTTGLPYKYRIMWANNQTNLEEISDVQINKMDIKDFVPARYIPADYDIEIRGQGRVTPPEVNLTGITAPNWILSDANNESFALKDFTSKVLLLQFSGIGCPPCHASLPFFNRLVDDYKDKSFELVRIECWNNNTDIIKSYISTNDIKYKFLKKDAEIEKNYNTMGSVPILFILDGNRTIQYVKRGYSTESEKEIIEAIDKLL